MQTLNLEPLWLGVAGGGVGGASGADLASWVLEKPFLLVAQMCVLLDGLKGTTGLSLLVFAVVWKETGCWDYQIESPPSV